MKGLKLVNGDLVFDENGELEMVSDDDEIVQNLEMILSTQLGEFQLDETIGLDRSNILTKQFDEEQAHYDIVEALMQEDRVAEVREIIFTPDKKNRRISIDVTVVKTDGSSVSLEGVTVDA
ncbi:DUF2634 domain-containing protein [Heyndrickxia coagulans]|uniref:DUF2634 domain-containing protein n=1 Tax=Heyndrickxia coagulans TaxID=1398 RepID=UPI0022365C34|nr:DUF2634 domain-containing protein [Heyndrickxia coagulans]UZH06410.1 DUF2634 domain-containing protein [Heyndrickxia coagulans]UZH06460.1 DUF2634 domain-containing protein [Heyndrickxia coagulans]